MEENTLRLSGKTLFMNVGPPPFFWLGIIDHTLVNSAKDGKITITQQELSKNAERMNNFLKEHHSDAMLMFMDFFRYLRKNYSKKKKLVMEMPVLLKEEGRAKLRRELTAIEEGRIEDLTLLDKEESPHHSCGWPMQASFERFSDVYFELVKHEKLKAPQKFERSKLIQFIVLLALCPVVTVMVAISFIEDGITIPVAVMAFANLIFYIYSISHIQVQVQLFKAGQGNAEAITVDPEGWIDDF